MSGLFDDMTAEQKTLMDLLEPLNVKARYPASRAEIGRMMTKAFCESLVESTTEKQKWIRQRLLNM